LHPAAVKPTAARRRFRSFITAILLCIIGLG
jgi:hypothetical protein